MTTIGIIGAGAIGSAFARALAKQGIQGVIANSRGPESLQELVRQLGPSIKAGTREEAAVQDIVLVAVNWSKLPAALAGLPDFGGRIVIDANNPIEAPLFRPVELHGRTPSEFFAELVPGARVVKALNHLQPHLVAGGPRAEGGGRRAEGGGRRAEGGGRRAGAVLLWGRCPRQGCGGRTDRAARLFRH